MASGHEYRANRPNTWLLRPTLQSENSSCQPGAVHTWPKSAVVECLLSCRCRGTSGHQPAPDEYTAFCNGSDDVKPPE
jgi:hypothetical protein